MREEIFMNNFFDEKQQLFDRLDNVISTLPANPSSLMDILFEAQNITYLSKFKVILLKN